MRIRSNFTQVAGLASPGEILVSRTVKGLVAGSGTTFEDLGTHELKGVPTIGSCLELLAEISIAAFGSPS